MKSYCVIYRTGGTENFKWHRTATFEERTDSHAVCDDLKRMGYKAMTEDYKSSMSIGLPETYEWFSNK